MKTNRAWIGLLGGCALGAAFVWACEDQTGSDVLTVRGEAGVLVSDGRAPADAAAPRLDALDASDASDAGQSLLDRLTGTWRGVGNQGTSTWTILVGIHAAPDGGVVGVMTYPSLACGGTLVVSPPPDGGASDGGGDDAGTDDAGDGMDGGHAGFPTITLHESVGDGCIREGEDTFTLLPNGDVSYEYRVAPAAPILATGTLTRVGAVGPATPFTGIWRSGDVNSFNVRPLLVSVSRDDSVGGVSGVYLLANAEGKRACGAHWKLTANAGGVLTLDEVFGDDQIGCDGPGKAMLRQIGATLQYTREVDGGGPGTDAGDGGSGAIELTRF